MTISGLNALTVLQRHCNVEAPVWVHRQRGCAMTDATQEVKKPTTGNFEAPETALTSNEDMARYSSSIGDLRSGGRSEEPSLPKIEIDLGRPHTLPALGGEDNGGRIQTLPVKPGVDYSGEPQILPVRPGDVYNGQPQILPVRPGGETPWNRRPGEMDPDLARRLRNALDDMVTGPPDAMDKLPSPQDQASLKMQAKQIADLIGKNGDFYAGMKREQVEAMFEAATGAGEENLNFLVRSVNEELANRGSNMQLGYNFGSEKAWYARDVVGDLYSKPFSVDENRSTVALFSRGPNGMQTHDRIRSRSSFDLPGYHPSSDPNGRRVLELHLD